MPLPILHPQSNPFYSPSLRTPQPYSPPVPNTAILGDVDPSPVTTPIPVIRIVFKSSNRDNPLILGHLMHHQLCIHFARANFPSLHISTRKTLAHLNAVARTAPTSMKSTPPKHNISFSIAETKHTVNPIADYYHTSAPSYTPTQRLSLSLLTSTRNPPTSTNSTLPITPPSSRSTRSTFSANYARQQSPIPAILLPLL
jgi:hypothetical protein